MNIVIFYAVSLVLNAVIIFIITNFLLDLYSNTSFYKAFVVALIILLLDMAVFDFTEMPTGFHANMFYMIFRFSLYIISLIFIKIVYAMSWRELVYFFIYRLIAGLLVGLPLYEIFHR
jgi:hypothetical protein